MDQNEFHNAARTYSRIHLHASADWEIKNKISFLIEIKLDLCKFINQIQKMDTNFMTLKINLENFFEILF